MFEFMLKKLASKEYPYDDETEKRLLKYLENVDAEISKEAQLLLFLLPDYQDLLKAYGRVSCHVFHEKTYERILADNKSVEILKYLVCHGHSLAPSFVVNMILSGEKYDDVLEIYFENRNISDVEQMALFDESVSPERAKRLLRVLLQDSFLCDKAENAMVFKLDGFDLEIKIYHRLFGLNHGALELAVEKGIIKAES